MNTKRSVMEPAAVVVSVLLCVGASAQRGGALPEGVTMKPVTIWSDGTRMAGDLYSPKDSGAGDKRPAIIMSHGWGGTKAGLRRYAAAFAEGGFIVLAFDYRGWGESESRVVVKGTIPKPDANGMATVEAQLIRTVVDPYDQVEDIGHAFDYIMGEPQVDTSRLGYWGSSYSGAHAVWVAANEKRASCVVGQVSAANSLDLAQTSWKGTDIVAEARKRAIERARGEADAVPQGTDKAPNLNGWAVIDKVIRYNPVDQASQITIPMLLIDAENEELFDRHQAGELAAKRAKANGAEVKYYVEPGITHYGIYSGKPAEKATKMALDWFNTHLK